jgi:hypothetical protein
MKIEHLEERVTDYRDSIKEVVDKKTLWKTTTSAILLETLRGIAEQFKIGWKVQELNWIHNSPAINIAFESFPPELMDCTNRVPEYQFIPGGALVFSQSYSGDVYIFIMFPILESLVQENGTLEIGLFGPNEINEKLIVEKVDEFLKEMIKWELPNTRTKVGY